MIDRTKIEQTIREPRCRRCYHVGTDTNSLREEQGVMFGSVAIVPPTYVHERPCA